MRKNVSTPKSFKHIGKIVARAEPLNEEGSPPTLRSSRGLKVEDKMVEKWKDF